MAYQTYEVSINANGNLKFLKSSLATCKPPTPTSVPPMATMWTSSALACCDMKAPKQQGALPPLPAPDRTMWQYGKQIDHYTAEQMKAYARHYAEMCNENGWCATGWECSKSKE